MRPDRCCARAARRYRQSFVSAIVHPLVWRYCCRCSRTHCSASGPGARQRTGRRYPPARMFHTPNRGRLTGWRGTGRRRMRPGASVTRAHCAVHGSSPRPAGAAIRAAGRQRPCREMVAAVLCGLLPRLAPRCGTVKSFHSAMCILWCGGVAVDKVVCAPSRAVRANGNAQRPPLPARWYVHTPKNGYLTRVLSR